MQEVTRADVAYFGVLLLFAFGMMWLQVSTEASRVQWSEHEAERAWRRYIADGMSEDFCGWEEE